MGKLGAADVVGIVKNDEKFSNFKFESNIFFDNLKYFYNKFSIYNKRDISSSLFIKKTRTEIFSVERCAPS